MNRSFRSRISPLSAADGDIAAEKESHSNDEFSLCFVVASLIRASSLRFRPSSHPVTIKSGKCPASLAPRLLEIQALQKKYIPVVQAVRMH